MGNTASSNKSNEHLEKDPSHLSKDHSRPERTSKRRDSIHSSQPAKASVVPASVASESEKSKKHPSSQISSTSSHSRARSRTQVPDPSRSQGPDPQAHGKSAARAIPGQHDTTSFHPEDEMSQGNPQAMPTPPRPVPTDPNIQGVKSPEADHYSSSTPTSSNTYAPNTVYTRAPRLPLPIEQEVLSPGSPIISPADIPGDPIGKDDEDVAIERKASLVSSTGYDEEDAGEDYNVPVPSAGPTLDTLVEWKQGGERVYVTGSFSGWNKKHRLHRNGPSKEPGVLSAMIPLPAGTHHLTFLVDGNMRISSHLPTAVDYTNVLINYLEVSVDDLPRQTIPLDIHPQPYQPGRQATESQTVPAGYHRPVMLPPPSPDLKPTAPSTSPSADPSGISAQTTQVKSATSSQTQLLQGHGPQKRFFSDKAYHQEIPRFLQDLDAPEESSRFARANAVMTTQPAPPSLPMFLNKSILNGQLPMKDDASVLIMPNHTVLNHLATTSIKNHVLATSATTRYKRKYVTTIMHKPTGDSAK